MARTWSFNLQILGCPVKVEERVMVCTQDNASTGKEWEKNGHEKGERMLLQKTRVQIEVVMTVE